MDPRISNSFRRAKEIVSSTSCLIQTEDREAVLTREEEGIQHLVSYTSKALHKANLRYSSLEKLAYTIVMAARKLWPYFMEHPIEVLTNYPLKHILQKPDTFDQMVK